MGDESPDSFEADLSHAVQLGEKRLSAEDAARMFVHATLDSIEDAWPHVAGLIRESPHFERPPHLDEEDAAPFLLVVLAGNLEFIPQFFEGVPSRR